MVIFTAFFDPDFKGKTMRLDGQYLEHFKRAFPDHKKQLNETDMCIAYFLGRDNSDAPAYALRVAECSIKINEIALSFETGRVLEITSGAVAAMMRKTAAQHGWADDMGFSPLVCVFDKDEAKKMLENIKFKQKTDAMLVAKDYKGICMMYAPLKEANKNPGIWDDADTLYTLGLSCSRLAVTLLVKAGEKKKLENAAKYRAYCVAFLNRGFEIEEDNARFATALAYRYYSNVHELMRPGERRDSDLEHEMEKANEWLSKAIEMNPESVRNHYRKGKLIIEKQAPYLLFGKKAFGKGEATLLREIRQVGEEHLATAISLYEALDDADKKMADRREYAKALFVLGRHYHSDVNLPMHEYFARKLVGDDRPVHIEKIVKLNLESARMLLEKCFAAETNMSPDVLDIQKLCTEVNEWTRTPVEKLYQIGCVYLASAFVHLAEGNSDKATQHAETAIRRLQSAKRVADSCRDRKRNTWHISEKIAWAHIILGTYAKAAGLLVRAKAGYIVNTYAIALLLTGSEANAQKAKAALNRAAQDKHNLAVALSKTLYAYTQKLYGEDYDVKTDELSEKNAAVARVLGVTA